MPWLICSMRSCHCIHFDRTADPAGNPPSLSWNGLWGRSIAEYFRVHERVRHLRNARKSGGITSCKPCAYRNNLIDLDASRG
jgi:hypothetical protein